jgi:UDP-N-acetylglucosamine/UDP-N-acetylgalactosamine diphosphorylase
VSDVPPALDQAFPDVRQAEDRLCVLAAAGVRIVDPRQTFVGDDVDLSRVHPGAVLHPGVRLHGPRTFLGPGASVGAEGPAVLVDAVLGEGAAVASGYVRGAVLLAGASLGANSHVREGTLLEEQASTAHCVGLKQTILLPFVTLGSLINFCDVLMAGGTSRRDHSEVGSGFIHFNFTPWGAAGDKATASLAGDVTSGVFLDRRRIFLGGAGGMIGPRSVGYGSIAGAGQVLRRDVAGDHLVVEASPVIDLPVRPPGFRQAEQIRTRNVEYIAQLEALRTWYRHVRLPRAAAAAASAGGATAPAAPTTQRGHLEIVTAEAEANVEACIAERWQRLRSFVAERGQALPPMPGPDDLDRSAPPPDLVAALDSSDAGGYVPHLDWVQALPPDVVRSGREWLEAVASELRSRLSPAG